MGRLYASIYGSVKAQNVSE